MTAPAPIAIVGMACRLPQASGRQAFWRLLRDGVDAVTPGPSDVRAGLGAYGPGGYLDGIDGFDAAFFGVSPGEAAAMDPQQRLVLELAWEALEDARILPGGLRGSRTSVIVGAGADDYAALVRAEAAENAHTLVGVQRAMIANRVSHLLGLRGPSLTVDAGQCSSLLAVHQCCDHLRTGDADLALAGGVNLIVSPRGTQDVARTGALSPDGRCRTFDAAANGYARGEGGAVVVLEPLARARALGHRVYAVILGGAVNNDGGDGDLSVPDQTAQEEVLRRAYDRAGVAPSAVTYVELHGTGTPVGDPVEAAALGAVAGTGRPAGAPLLVGSAKTNVGHLEAGAGIVGLVKAALSVHEGELPPSLHFRSPNPRIPLENLRLAVVTSRRPWPEGRARVAGVSSFGMGGTNCHLVVAAPEPAPDGPAPGAPRDGVPLVWPVSARTEPALRRVADRLTTVAGDAGIAPGDVGFSLGTTRTAFERRAAVVAGDRAGLRAGLLAVAGGEPGPGVVRGAPVEDGLAVLFSGQGAQRAGMGRGLYAAFPAFAETFDRVTAELDRHLDRPLREVMWDGGPLDHTAYTQPALFAYETALFRLYAHWGVRPRWVAGHSIGELAAAHVAGVLSLADACGLVAARGRLMGALPPGGAMVSVQASEDEVRAVLDGHPGTGIGAVNGPRSVVLSGEEAATLRLAGVIAGWGRKTRRLRVSHAFHSSLMEPALDALRAVADGLAFRPAAGLTVVSTLTGAAVPAEELASADYWVRQARGTVRFADAIEALHGAGARVLAEAGPGGQLTVMGRGCVHDPGTAFVSGPRGDAEALSAATALATLHVRGVPVDWAAYYGPGRTAVDLPGYPFQRRAHWLRAADVAVGPADDGTVDPADAVRAHTAAALGADGPDAVDVTRTYRDLGFTSLMAVELAESVGRVLGRVLPSTVAFDHPTPAALIAYLRGEPGAPGAAPRPVPAVPAPSSRRPPPPGDPIAIIGAGCRFPGGVESPADLWCLVDDGADAISTFPADRGWDLAGLYDPDPDRAGTTYTRHGGFLRDVAGFDAEFFGVSPREAEAMDPQQRLLLETSWEAFERGGIDPAALTDRSVGVFAGAMTQEYGPRLDAPAGGLDGYVLTGNAVSVASGRVAYVFDLNGPAVTVDTACSSSLVAIHLAVQALRRGECAMALAGGATVMASPGMLVEFARQRGLAPDGRCKAFAAAADGTAWAEGAGMLLLEPLSAARAAGHPVLAVIRGSATNQDGASNGLTAPSGRAQEMVIRAALADAGLRPGDVDAVEAHGTGTALGDPIEARALLATYGAGRDPGDPLWLGSLKSNIGHAQAAAGVGGLLKMAYALRHGRLPRSLHIDAPSPHVEWAAGGVRLLTEARTWPERERPRRCGVSSLGISGTNAHVILEEAPREAAGAVRAPVVAPVAADGAGTVPWVVSAKSAAALRAQAGRLREFAARRPDARAEDVAYTLATARAGLPHRAVVLAGGGADAARALGALADGGMDAGLVSGVPDGARPVFVFPGQGGQWPGMGVALLDASPVFRARMEACARAIEAHVDWSVLDVLRGTPGAPSLDRVDVAQPVLFAVMMSLAALWESLGVRPSAVIGHSQGEIAAACVAGALSLEDAAAVAALRSKAIAERLAGSGAMASVALGAAELRKRIERPAGVEAGELWVAAVNGPASAVVAGDGDAVDAFVAACGAEGVHARRVDVDYASHTPQVEPVRDAVRTALAAIEPRVPRVPLYSTLTGRPLAGADTDAAYWYRNLRNPVQFEPAVRALAADLPDAVFIEVSPHPVVSLGVAETLEDAGAAAMVSGTLRRGEGGWARFLLSAGEAYAHGAPVDWAALFAGCDDVRRVDLPTYAFQRRRYWAPAGGSGSGVADAGLTTVRHPLLRAATTLPDADGTLLTGHLSLRTHPWLRDHAVSGTVLVPATAFAELAVQAADRLGCDRVEELTLCEPLAVPERDGVRLRVLARRGGDGGAELGIYAQADDAPDGAWTTHATGRLVTTGPVLPAVNGSAWPPPGAEPCDVADAYERLAERGYAYGPGFRGLSAAWRHGDEVYAEVAPPGAAPEDGFALHPALLDAALHAWLAVAGDGLLLPFAWQGIRVHTSGSARLRVRMAPVGPDEISLHVTDAAGVPVLDVARLTFRPATPGELRAARFPAAMYRLRWTPVTGPDADGHVTVLGDLLPGAPVVRYADVAALTRALTGDDGRRGGGPEVVFAGVSARTPAIATHATLRLLQEWAAEPALEDIRLAIVTGTGLAHAAVTGLVASAQAENPGRFVHIQADDPAPRDLAAAAASGEPRVRTGDDPATVTAPRLARVNPRDLLVLPAGAPAWRLDTRERGLIENLTLVPYTPPPLLDGQIRIAVRAAGVNFRDVVVALGLVPTEEGMGLEGAGVVTETGPGVTRYAVGDRVMGLFDGAFGPVAVADQRTVVPVPDGWSFPEAATVPVAFLTAYLGLVDVAQVRPGERLLVHAAAGGVGMAAVQLGRHLGAEVFGTAHPRKWAALHALGLDGEHIASSRDLAFERDFPGVDVVLNSLAKEYVDASLRLLRPGGRLAEMGKTDRRDPERVAAEHPGVAYLPFNLPDLAPDRVQRMLTEVMDLFARGVLRPLRRTDRSVRAAPEVFRAMSAGAHTGKIVLTPPRGLDPDGTVLITGGTGTLGTLIARHLVTRYGVRHLLLLGRRGPDAEGAAELRRELTESGAEVTIAACDAADRAALARTLAEVPDAHPLTGVVHAAGVLDDGVISSLTPERLDRVMRPKVDAAWHLHLLTRDHDLAAFVLFSSAVGVLGEPGQGNYAAANTYLDGLAAYRRARGLAATSLAWGLWSPPSGMTGHLDGAALTRLRRSGVAPLSAEHGLALFDQALDRDEPLLVPMRLDAASADPDAAPPVLRDLVVRASAPVRATAGRGAAPDDAAPGLADRLAVLPETERRDVLQELVRAESARVLGHPDAAAVPPGAAFKDLGLDSLTAVELRNRLASATGLRLPADQVLNCPTPVDLCERLVAALGDAGGTHEEG